MKVKKHYIYTAIFVVFLTTFFHYMNRASLRQFSDFRVSYSAAERFADKEYLYSKFEDKTIANFKYSPFFAMLFAPLSVFTLSQAAAIFFVINFIFTVLIFVFSKKMIVEGQASPKEILWLYLLPLLFTFRHILAVLDAGQVNIVMVGLVVMGLYFLKKENEVMAAALIMLSIMFKYTPFIFLPYLFFRKKWRLIAWSVVFMAAYCLAPMLYVGVEKGVEALKGWLPFVVSTSLDIGSLCDFKNQSLYSMITRYFSTGQYFCDRLGTGFLSVSQGVALSIAVSGVLYLCMMPFNPVKLPGGLRDRVDYSLLFIGLAFFNANSWSFNYMALIFSYMALTYYLLRKKRKDKFIVAAMILSVVLGAASRDIVGKGLKEWADILSLVTIGALFLLLAFLKIKFYPQKEGLS